MSREAGRFKTAVGWDGVTTLRIAAHHSGESYSFQLNRDDLTDLDYVINGPRGEDLHVTHRVTNLEKSLEMEQQKWRRGAVVRTTKLAAIENQLRSHEDQLKSVKDRCKAFKEHVKELHDKLSERTYDSWYGEAFKTQRQEIAGLLKAVADLQKESKFDPLMSQRVHDVEKSLEGQRSLNSARATHNADKRMALAIRLDALEAWRTECGELPTPEVEERDPWWKPVADSWKDFPGWWLACIWGGLLITAFVIGMLVYGPRAF